MMIGRWSELSVDRVCQEHEVMRDADANETSGELGSALGGTLVGVSQLRIPWSEPLIESAIFLPPVSIDFEYQYGWCPLNHQRLVCPVSSEGALLNIDTHCCKRWLGECRLPASMAKWGSYSDSADDGCLEKDTDLWMKIRSTPPRP